MQHATAWLKRALFGTLALPALAFSAQAQTVFINEIHYDNVGGDVAEGVEIAGPAGTDLSAYTIYLYNGADGKTYTPTTVLSSTIADQQNGYGTVNFAISGIQNGAPDGLALVKDDTTVVQFLSYEGSFTASNGPAKDLLSTDIGVSEQPAPDEGLSLQLTGTGQVYTDFTWSGPVAATPDAVNAGQTFRAAVVTPTERISPIVDSLVTNCDGTYTAYFGYFNRNSSTVTVATGANNRFSPLPQDRGQTTEFLAGRQRKVFAVSFSGPGNLVWTLKSPNGQQSTATAGPGAALPATGCACQNPTLPSYAGGYVLNSAGTRAFVQVEVPEGGLSFQFYNTHNLVVGAPEASVEGGVLGGVTQTGATFTFTSASPATVFFPIERADPEVARVSFFLKVTDACQQTVDVDPAFALAAGADEALVTALGQARPNPTRDRAVIDYSLAEAGRVRLVVYDVLGREVATLVDGQVEAGAHEATFEGGSFPSGVYVYRLVAGATTRTGTVTLAR